jgi:phenylalanyl-tRNA synthetase beta chain
MNPCESFMKRVSQWFAVRSYHETISYSFVDPGLQASLYPQIPTLELLNPISSELSSMRAGLWPGLIASMIHNMHRQQQTIRIFEMGVTFDMSEGNLIERTCVGGLLMGEKGHLNWSETASFLDFYDGKGDLEALFKFLQLPPVEWVAAEHPALHPGKTAKILIAGQPAGWLGSLHPRLADALNIQDQVTLFELDINFLMKKQKVTWKSVTKYPHIRRDLSFLVDTQVQVGALEAAIRRVANANWFKSFDIFDVYTGKGIPEGKKSLAVALILQNPERTLVDAEINSEINAIIKVLVEEFSITLRE